MTEAADLRAQAARMREFAVTVTDPREREEIELMAAEFDARAKTLDNGDAGKT